ncbi:hypothetical protein GXW82_29030 [Streptacidiphilus sp. 4-A2]|nr:hypothetical protein [Streptacidiphilus sp. 4-A2]
MTTVCEPSRAPTVDCLCTGVFWAVSTFTAHATPWVATLLELNPALIFDELMRDALLTSVQTCGGLPSHVWPVTAAWSPSGSPRRSTAAAGPPPATGHYRRYRRYRRLRPTAA